MSNITLNIVEPGSPTPVDPGIDPAVPNTGLFTHGIGSTEATIIVGTVLILAIVGIILVAYMYRKQKKTGKVTKLVHIIDQTKAVIKSKKRITAGLAVISLLVSVGTFIALTKNGVNAVDTDNQAEDEAGLTVSTSDQELTIEVGDEPVFAVLPVEVTVEEATVAGYTLTAYTDNTDLVSTTDSSKVIPMVTIAEADIEAAEEEVAEEGKLTTLTANTYGLALGNEPTSKDDKVYTSLSTDIDNPTILKTIDDYAETPANDTTTIYYAFYITPDIPYGTYTNDDSEVYYNATINTTLITFDGNGLYFNNEEEQQQTTNEIEYIAVPQEEGEGTINQIISGQYQEPTQSLPYNFLGWSTDDQATSPTYTSEQEIAESLPIKPNQPITLYAIWQKVTNIIFNSNDDTGTTSTQSIIAGQSTNLNPNTFTREGYTFTGWNTEATPTEQEPGTPYADKAEYTAPLNKSQNLTLYAQWVVPPTDLTFTAGDHIDTLIVADSSQNWKPFYVTPTSADRSIVFTAPAEGTKYIITVVPEAGYVLSSDSANSSYEVAFSTGALASNTLLTTTYTSGNAGNNITVSAASAGSDTAHPAYTTMQSLTAAQCPGQGINVTDSRNNKSYAVAKFGNYCYMLSNIRVDGNTVLTSTTSHVSSTYTLPADTGSGGWTDDACQPRMASTNGEYYYNWPAATARTNSTSSTSSCSNDTSNSKGDICPAGWSLPTYQDITPATLWNSGANPGMLSTAGYFYSRSQLDVGDGGSWWSSTRYNNNSGAYRLAFNGTTAYRNSSSRSRGSSVRCMRSS